MMFGQSRTVNRFGILTGSLAHEVSNLSKRKGFVIDFACRLCSIDLLLKVHFQFS
jgi:hypothetical protein